MMGLLAPVEFGQSDLERVLATLSPAEIDALEFGVIQLDATGKILAYNETESKIMGRQKASVIGCQFFEDIAPCCNNPAFRGTFDAGVKSGKLDAIFNYTFDYMVKPTRMRIHMKKAVADNAYWVFVKRL